MTYQQMWRRLAQVYDEGEAKAIARIVFEERYGLSFSDLLMGRDAEVPADETEQIVRRLERQEPVQYVLGRADFCGRSFRGTPAVLIPRPETEELCRWQMAEGRWLMADGATILDIGTGSGCIAITLAAELPAAQVTAWDISAEALMVARQNAALHQVSVVFEQRDALHAPTDHARWDVIVSNPPYITDKEREAMEKNVLEHEPHQALFVPDDDPLLFYRAIARYGLQSLKSNGWLYFEINPLFADELAHLISMMSYHDIEIKADSYGKQRMLRARR